jgi:hypothetical protein
MSLGTTDFKPTKTFESIFAEQLVTEELVATGNDNTLGFTLFTGVGIDYFQLGPTVVQNSGSAPFFDIATIPSGIITVTPVGSSPNSAGAVASGSTLTLEPADGTNPGVLTAIAQTIGGSKTFVNAINAPNLTGSNTGDVTLINVSSSSNAAGATLFGQVLNLNVANATFPGVLSASTQTIGGSKTFVNAITAPNISGTNTGDVVLTTLGGSPNTAGASLSGQVLTLQPANASNPGLLSAGTQTIAGAKTFPSGVTTPSVTFSTGATLNPATLISSSGTQTTNVLIPRVPFGSDTIATLQAVNVFANTAEFQNTVTTDEGILNSSGGDSAPSYSFITNPTTGLFNSGGALGITTNGTAAITYDIAQKGVASGFFFCNPTYGWQYYNGALPQPLTAGVWVKIATNLAGSTLGSSANVDAASTDNQIVYDDSPNAMMLAQAELSFALSTSAELSLSIYYDSTPPPTNSTSVSVGGSSITLSLVNSTVIPMFTGDYVEAWIMADTSCTLTLVNLNFRLTNMC